MAHNDDGAYAGEKPTVAWSRASAGGRTKLGQAGEVVGHASHTVSSPSEVKSDNSTLKE